MRKRREERDAARTSGRPVPTGQREEGAVGRRLRVEAREVQVQEAEERRGEGSRDARPGGVRGGCSPLLEIVEEVEAAWVPPD